MSRNSKDFSQYSFSEYPQRSEPEPGAELLNYADPRFYETQVETGKTVQQAVREAEVARNYQMSEYTGPASLEHYTYDAGAAQRESAQRGHAEGAGSSQQRRRWVSLGSLSAGVALLVKFGIPTVSVLISVAVYANLFGLPFGIGLVALLFVHEMGHAIVMKLKKVPIGGMIFIPLFGAAVIMRQMPKNAKDEAEIGIAGPIAGGLAAGFCLLIAYLSPLNPGVWGPLAYFGFLLNLFNLVPIIPFDGGRVLAAIDRRIWIVGFLGLVAFQLWEWFWLKNISSPWLLLFIIMAATQLMMRNNAVNTPETQAYYTVPVGERIALGLAYFGLAALLVLGMALAHSLMYSAL
jgi:Zn-dependent protease